MEVIVAPSAQKDLFRLPKIERKKIQKKLLLLEFSPFVGKKLGGEFEGQFSLKAWPYRIIYWINISKGKLFITSILHRQGAYN